MLGSPYVHMALRVATLSIVLVVPGLAKAAEVFPLEKSSVVDFLDVPSTDFSPVRWIFQLADFKVADCRLKPFPDVVYPGLHSPTPQYGCLPLSADADDVLYFVVDEAPSAEESTAEVESQEMRARATEYDLLYVDTDGDGDLTDEPPLRRMKQPPRLFADVSEDEPCVVFDYLEIKSAGEGKPPACAVRVLPWMNVDRSRTSDPVAGHSARAQLCVLPVDAHTGRIRIGNTWYNAQVGLRMRGPASRFFVQREPPAGVEPGNRPWKRVDLGMHQVGTEFYEISASSTGDRLTVARFRGAMGEFRVEPGTRSVGVLGAAGALEDSTGSTVWIGEPNNYDSEEWSRACQLPAGDYQFSYLSVALGDLYVRLSAGPIPMSDDSAAGVSGFPIAIRAGQPFVMRFSDQPTVQFLSPPIDSASVFRRGTSISLRAQLVDPTLGCVICGLHDTTQKTGETLYLGDDGETRRAIRYASLVPQVSITNAAGKEVASGTMPFG